MNYPGWKPEGFMRMPLSHEDVLDLIAEIEMRMPDHFKNYGAGVFTHPQEIVGCMYGQLMKLSIAADASIYTGELKDFRERCWKTLAAILVGLMSVDKLIELREGMVAAPPTVNINVPEKICGKSKAVDKKPGPVLDNSGKVVRISTQKGDEGYDPEIHLNQNLKIFCDGKHISTAHTADTRLGIVWYYEKNARSRIETKTVNGKVEIQGF